MKFRALEQLISTRMYLRIVEQDMKFRFLANDNGIIKTAIVDAVMSMQT